MTPDDNTREEAKFTNFQGDVECSSGAVDEFELYEKTCDLHRASKAHNRGLFSSYVSTFFLHFVEGNGIVSLYLR